MLIPNSIFEKSEENTSKVENTRNQNGLGYNLFQDTQIRDKRRVTYQRRASRFTTSTDHSKSLLSPNKGGKKPTPNITQYNMDILQDLANMASQSNKRASAGSRPRPVTRISGFKKRCLKSQNLKTRPETVFRQIKLSQKDLVFTPTCAGTTHPTDKISDLKS